MTYLGPLFAEQVPLKSLKGPAGPSEANSRIKLINAGYP